MDYSRTELDEITKPNGSKSKFEEAVNTLSKKVFNHEKINLAEEQFICGVVKNLRDINNVKTLNIEDYKSCENYIFRTRYMLYSNDLNGNREIYDFDGQIENQRKKSEVEYLNKQFIDWQNLLKNKLIGFELINYIAQETHNQINEIEKYCNKNLIGKHKKDYIKKSLTLHGKYIYLLVKEFYQELEKENEIVEINGQNILIDSFSYVHTLFRHYAKKIKEHQNDKSYHLNEKIGFKSVPNYLFDILIKFKSIVESVNFNKKNVFFNYNNQYYAIWFRPFKQSKKGNVVIEYLRMQTFYPIEDKTELENLKSKKAIIVNNELTFFT